MRFVTVRDLRGHSAQVWHDLEAARELVVTSNGKPVAILSAVSGETLETSLSALRRARAMAAVASLQQESAERGTDRLPPSVIDKEIVAVRKKRR